MRDDGGERGILAEPARGVAELLDDEIHSCKDAEDEREGPEGTGVRQCGRREGLGTAGCWVLVAGGWEKLGSDPAGEIGVRPRFPLSSKEAPASCHPEEFVPAVSEVGRRDLKVVVLSGLWRVGEFGKVEVKRVEAQEI